MDQVKAILSQLQKHHFWLLSVIAMIAAFVGWFMATRSLSAAYEANKSTVNGKFSSLQGILSSPDKPPNAAWGEGIGKLTTKEKEAVRIAWEKVYNEQKQHLEWPPELGDKFLNFVKNNPPEATIPKDLCALYQDRIIKSEFPRLLAIIEARPHNVKAPLPDGRAKPGEQAPPAAKVEEAKVVWDSGSQQEAEKMLNFQTVPSSAEVRQAQEDIWVYKAVLNVIRNMNKDTFVGRVRRIQDISIGQKAAGSYQAGLTGVHVEHMKSAAAAGGEAAAAPAPAPPPAEGEAAAKPIDEGRYLDAEGKVAPPGQAATQQFKRMPVFLKLTMDQREINRFLVECSNSPLLIEVTQLRINPSQGHSSSSSKSAAAPGGQSAGGRAPGSPPTESESYEVPVEIAGIIYIYNPPDKSKLGGGEPATTPGTPAAAAAGGGQ